VAVKTRTGTTGTGKLYFTFTDHLGNIAGLGEGSTFTSGSLARLDPFGNYRTAPSTNPTVTNQGFTGHRHNNTGSFPVRDVGLIYMNARYYMPEVGRFISPDAIVPEPTNPQSYNRPSNRM
jgi:RHS repeat-associated protein